MQVNYEVEKLIALIKTREAIWNYRCPSYNDKELRRNQWLEVCRELVTGFEEKSSSAQDGVVISFQKQWKVLRDSFLRALKNMKKKGSTAKPYTYHNELQFMNELYDDLDKEIKKSGESSEEKSEVEHASTSVPTIKRRRKRKIRYVPVTKQIEESKEPPAPEVFIEKITNYIENEERAKQNTENDEDKLFLLSLLNDFKSVPDEYKLDAKFDILNVLRHYRNIGGRSSAPRAKHSRNCTSVTSTENKTEFCYVKCEDDEFEED